MKILKNKSARDLHGANSGQQHQLNTG